MSITSTGRSRYADGGTGGGDFDPAWPISVVAEFEGRSPVSINRAIREGKFPREDFRIGKIRFWLRSTCVRTRTERIAQTAAEDAALRERMLADAQRAQAERKRKIEERKRQAAPS